MEYAVRWLDTYPPDYVLEILNTLEGSDAEEILNDIVRKTVEQVLVRPIVTNSQYKTGFIAGNYLRSQCSFIYTRISDLNYFAVNLHQLPVNSQVIKVPFATFALCSVSSSAMPDQRTLLVLNKGAGKNIGISFQVWSYYIFHSAKQGG
jgi:hypothetical protein